MATEFNYTREWTDAGAFPLLGFTKNWENPEDYPTYEPDEMQVRKDMQSLHDEVKDFLNNELIPRVVAEDATVEAWTYAEEQRVLAETGRVEAETARVEAEDARAEAEAERISAEEARALAERQRVDSTNGIVAQATAQAEKAEEAVVDARAAAASASLSDTHARDAASVAVNECERVTEMANRAATSANEAAVSATAAANSAAEAESWANKSQSRVQANWAQNDFTQADYVKNRPFYDGSDWDKAYAVRVNGQTQEAELTRKLVLGDKYRVTFDGVSYELYAYSYEASSLYPNAVALGGLSEYPFFMVTGDRVGSVVGYIVLSGDYTTTTVRYYAVEVEHYTENVVKIPAKFLPEMLPAVTTDDNGKFLRVVDGAWAVASIQSAEEVAF